MDNTPPPLPAEAPKKPKNNFLTGCCVAAGIGAVLFILFFILVPMFFSSASIEIARATAMKSKGRDIWLAILSANEERKIHGMPPLWPGDLAEHGITFANAEEYFTYLMSDGVDINVITRNPEQRLVSDLSPHMFSASGLTVASPGGPLLPENNAWHVVVVCDNMPAETPFLVSRNVKASAIVYPAQTELDDPAANAVHIPLDKKIKPLIGQHAVWVSTGGARRDTRQHFFTRAVLFPVQQSEDEPPIAVLPAQGGFQ